MLYTHSNISPIVVSAPASVMLMGEHAVLFGHRAIVCALSQRLRVSVSARSDQRIVIHSALGHYDVPRAELLIQKNDPPELSFVLASLRALPPQSGLTLTVTSDFSHTVGLGSSAAVVAACVYALMRFQGAEVALADVFDIGLRVIHAVQQRGSGSDLAASVFGGMVAYTASPRQIEALLNAEQLTPRHCPALDLTYCGYKTPTPEVLAHVARASEEFPDIYTGLYQHMHQVSCAAEQAIRDHDWQRLGKLMNIYHGLMDALGVSDASLSALVYQARQRSEVLGAKISGSGLGDCVIALSSPQVASPQDEKTNIEGHIEANISPRGVQCESADVYQ